MLVAAISQTIVSPAMPRIVAELGGMEHYSWVATVAMLVSAITTPIVGKLSDLFGRRLFYLGGILVFLLGSVISGLSVSFAMLLVGRAVQGVGMGTLMPLSQTIIGDLVPPRQRGKYQGVMGAVFGVTSITGPLVGGLITDTLGWRWLFFVALPVGLVALVVIARFMHLPFERREARIDTWGMITLSVALVCILLATSWGGTSYPWTSPVILGLYAVGAVAVVAFVAVERRAEEPVIPLHLFRNSVFTLCLASAFLVAMLMFGAIIYVPVFAQGVLGVDATTSGLIVMPLSVGQIVMGIVAGLLITRYGRYKELMVLGVLVMAAGQGLLTRLGASSAPVDVTAAMIVLGVGIGTVMTSGLGAAIVRHLPPGSDPGAARQLDAGAVLDPRVLARLPDALATAVRRGLADQLHTVFLIGLPLVAALFFTTLFLKATPLRDTVHTAEEGRREYLDTMTQSAVSGGDFVLPLSEGRAPRTHERILGLQFAMLARQASADRPLLRRAVAELGDGDFDRGMTLLCRTAEVLSSEDERRVADAERYASEVATRAKRKHGLLSPDLRRDMAVAAAATTEEQVLGGQEVAVSARYEAVDVAKLVEAGSELTSALLVDLAGGQGAAAAR